MEDTYICPVCGFSRSEWLKCRCDMPTRWEAIKYRLVVGTIVFGAAVALGWGISEWMR